ncbi:hypothetical protein EUGRSUZ_C00307 [Eucalyptus grandis]|uniref:Uncharacterized protein n=2 Tax=Eucalyptus grandis TaxID=71139 RepID=A0ACC3LC68_EUCGR|nr:hypothetical protein EUGRSUZ_C00307 [Eucalyptus grandis]
MSWHITERKSPKFSKQTPPSTHPSPTKPCAKFKNRKIATLLDQSNSKRTDNAGPTPITGFRRKPKKNRIISTNRN